MTTRSNTARFGFIAPMPSGCAMGLLIGLFIVVGDSFSRTGSFDGLFASPLRGLVLFFAASVPSALVLSACFRGMDGLASRPRAARKELSPGLFARHPFAFSLVVLTICWLPYLAVFFPGSLPYDGVRSLNQFMTDAALENHHPVLMNMLYAVLYRAGSAFAGLMGTGVESAFSPDNLGIFAIVSFQTACCLLAFSGVVSFVAASRAPRVLAWGTLLFLALFPLWGVYAQAAMKDGLYNAVLAFFVLSIARIVVEGRLEGRRIPRSWWAVLVISAILACLTRNNGVYLAVPALVALAVLIRSRAAVAAALATTIVYVGVTGLLWPAIGVDMSTTQKEMLSVPFQQTARYLATYPDDVTDEERAAIEGVLPYDELPELYLPDLSDPVKESYKLHNAKVEGSEEYTEEHPDALKEYFRAWLSMGLRHPGCYVQATIANTYAYFYPFVIIGPEVDRSSLQFGIIQGSINETYFPHYVGPESVRTAFQSAIESSVQMPVLCWFWSPAPYVWALLAGWFYCAHSFFSLRRENQGHAAVRGRHARELAGEGTLFGSSRARWARCFGGMVVLIPATMLLLTTLAGPLNGHLRYIMPMIATLPVAFAVLTYGLGSQEKADGFGNADSLKAKAAFGERAERR